MRLAALDAIRAVYGRDGRRPRELVTDYAALERCDSDNAPIAAELNRTLARQATSDTTAIDERVAVIDALRALTDRERRAVLLSAQGLTDREVAAHLDITHQRARTLLMYARALLRSHTDPADHPPAPDDDWPLAGPATSKRQRRLMRRHLEHCPACHAAASQPRHPRAWPPPRG